MAFSKVEMLHISTDGVQAAGRHNDIQVAGCRDAIGHGTTAKGAISPFLCTS